MLIIIISCLLQLDVASTQGYVSYVSVNVPGQGYAFNYATFPKAEEDDGYQQNPLKFQERRDPQQVSSYAEKTTKRSNQRATYSFPSQNNPSHQDTQEDYTSQYHKHFRHHHIISQHNGNEYRNSRQGPIQQGFNKFLNIHDEITRRAQEHRDGRRYSSNKATFQPSQDESNTQVLEENPHLLNSPRVPLQYSFSQQYPNPTQTVRRPQAHSNYQALQDNPYSLSSPNFPQHSHKPVVKFNTQVLQNNAHPKVQLPHGFSQDRHTTTQMESSKQGYPAANHEIHEQINDVQISSHKSKIQHYPSTPLHDFHQSRSPTANNETPRNDWNQPFIVPVSIAENQKPLDDEKSNQNQRNNFDKQAVTNREEHVDTCCGIIPHPSFSSLSNTGNFKSSEPIQDNTEGQSYEDRRSTERTSKQMVNEPHNPLPFQSQLAVSRATKAELGKVSSSPNDTKPIHQLDPKLVSQLIRMMQASRNVSPNPQITGHIPIPATNSSHPSSKVSQSNDNSKNENNNRAANETQSEGNGNNGNNGNNHKDKASSIQEQTSPGKLFYPFLHLNFNLLHVINDGEPEIHVYPMIKTTIDTKGAT